MLLSSLPEFLIVAPEGQYATWLVEGTVKLAPLVLMVVIAPLAAAEVVLDDPAGDPELVLLANSTASSPDSLDAHIDLRSLDVLEGDETIVFEVAVEGADDSRGSPIGRYDMLFRADDQGYWLSASIGTAGAHAILSRDEGVHGYIPIQEAEVRAEFQLDEAVLVLEVPRLLLTNVTGTPPLPGMTLHEFNVEARREYNSIDGRDSEIRDAMPDSLFAGAYSIARGAEQHGDLRLFSPLPFRSSNGGATTYIFRGIVENAGEASREVALTVSNVPARWKVNAPERSVHLGAGEALEFPIAVTVPTGHRHGTVEQFMLRVSDSHDASHWSQAPFGVRFLEIPQPAGHHPKVFLHSNAGENLVKPAPAEVYDYFYGREGTVFMNTVEDYDGDEGAAVRGRPVGSADPRYEWTIELSPTLSIGIELDPAGTGQFTIPFTSKLGFEQANLSLEIYASSGKLGAASAGRLILRGESASQEMPSDTATQFTGSLEVANATTIPAGDHMRMWADIRFTAAQSLVQDERVSPPHLVPGGWLQLPLLEYHDGTAETFDRFTLVHTSFGTDGILRLPPGESVGIPLQVRNEAKDGRTYSIELLGAHAAWAQVAGTTTRTLAPGTTWSSGIVVTVPPDVPPGAAGDIVVEIADVDDPWNMAIHRIQVIADPAGTSHELHGTDRLNVDREKKTPGLPGALALAVISAYAIRRRTRT